MIEYFHLTFTSLVGDISTVSFNPKFCTFLPTDYIYIYIYIWIPYDSHKNAVLSPNLWAFEVEDKFPVGLEMKFYI